MKKGEIKKLTKLSKKLKLTRNSILIQVLEDNVNLFIDEGLDIHVMDITHERVHISTQYWAIDFKPRKAEKGAVNIGDMGNDPNAIIITSITGGKYSFSIDVI